MADAIQEEQVKKVQRLLEGWRMALLPLKSVFLWEQHWHPYAIIAAVSVLHFIIWMMDLSTLASLSLVGLVLNFIDFIVPIICNTIYKSNSWTGQNEKMFEDICRNIVVEYNKILNYAHSFYAMRENNPTLYYINSVSILSTLVWMASKINNIFLLYIFSSLVLLWPGIHHRGIFDFITPYLSCGSLKQKFLKSD